MGDRPIAVAVWSTGWVGKVAIRAIARRDDLELTGVWVHDPAKVGVDAGVLAGMEPLGVTATNDADALLASRPDCVCYAASGPDRDVAAVADYVGMLERGINVVTVSSAGLVHPAAYDPPSLARIEAAARHGGATIYASGIEPGFAGDHLVLTLLTMSSEVRSVRTQELFSYADYPVTFMMFDVFGFGKPLDHTPLMSMHGAQVGTWGPPVRMVADAMGVELDEIRETYERELTPRRLDVAAGTIEPGTVGAIRMETIGVVDGRDAIVIEHVNRMAPDLAPHWPSAARDGVYRIIIDGTPTMQCELMLGDDATASDEGMIATTMRIVNAIPYVCAAPPGAVSALDLPLTLPRQAF